ncbi:hypothetical protein TWF506_001105 [Arthrobotrys conoides]|uniref:Uncharacterized protein n=1 Tax=Arthrobotrys conoides TaxID=74498 RepID=A0AAN8RR33_9PEZI
MMSTSRPSSPLQSLEAGPRPGQTTVVRPLRPRYAVSVSDTESTTSDDPLHDSGSSCASISSASSISGDDEQEIAQGLINLTLANVGASDLECKANESKKESKESMPITKDSFNSQNPQDTTSKANLNNDRASEMLERLLGKRPYESEVAKAAGNETIACFPTRPVYQPAMNFAPSHVSIDVPAWQAGVRTHGHGHGKQSGSCASSGNSGARAPPIYPPHVKPPSEWGHRNRQGNDDGPDESNWGRENRGLRTKKRIACPAAKGDPFNNRNCLGVSFPNLAKTRQHLSCSVHFAVDKTPLLPDEIRDPNGWDEIMAYVYPDKDTPSSDEDFHPTMDIIEKWGMGEGKPDFRSTIIRLIKHVAQDPECAKSVINELEAIDPSAKEEQDTTKSSSSFYSSPSDMSSFPSGVVQMNSSLFVPHTGFHLNSPVNSEPSQTTFASTSINTPISGSGGPASAVFPSYNPGTLPSTAGFGNHDFSSFTSQSNVMDTSRCSPDVPDLHNQADNDMRMSPAGGPAPDKQLHMYLRLSGYDYDFRPLGSNVNILEDSLKCYIADFSFKFYYLNIINDPTRPFNVGSINDLRAIYPDFGRAYPGQEMIFEALPKLPY